MKLLFDESLSPRLVDLLCDLFRESALFATALSGSGEVWVVDHWRLADYFP
jgi:predicted nuclease of predicted toxin-antitoxin system